MKRVGLLVGKFDLRGDHSGRGLGVAEASPSHPPKKYHSNTNIEIRAIYFFACNAKRYLDSYKSF